MFEEPCTKDISLEKKNQVLCAGYFLSKGRGPFHAKNKFVGSVVNCDLCACKMWVWHCVSGRESQKVFGKMLKSRKEDINKKKNKQILWSMRDLNLTIL